MIVNQIKRMIPTLKVNNRNLNESFYIETLGMKPLLEESAFLSHFILKDFIAFYKLFN